MDVSWLATEAKTLHQVFASLFYVMTLTTLSLAVILEYFKLPLGGTPQFVTLIGRVFIASILFVATPEIMNMLATFTDAVTTEIGGFNNYKLVLDRMGDKVSELSWSWVSIKDSILLVISFLTFFVLYLVVYFSDAMFMFVWLLLYIMSPILIALYILPVTASATMKLYKSLVEVCVWKILWCVLSALLWSFAVSDINKPEAEINFLTAIILNIMLAYSVAMTPKITASFLGAGISEVASNFGGMLQNAAALTPHGMVTKLPMRIRQIRNGAQKIGSKAKKFAQSAKKQFSDGKKTTPTS
jgi:hypothetical protein